MKKLKILGLIGVLLLVSACGTKEENNTKANEEKVEESIDNDKIVEEEKNILTCEIEITDEDSREYGVLTSIMEFEFNSTNDKVINIESKYIYDLSDVDMADELKDEFEKEANSLCDDLEKCTVTQNGKKYIVNYYSDTFDDIINSDEEVTQELVIEEFTSMGFTCQK